jgi:hypothetical protein
MNLVEVTTRIRACLHACIHLNVTSPNIHGEYTVPRGTALYQMGRALSAPYHELFLSLRNRTPLDDELSLL